MSVSNGSHLDQESKIEDQHWLLQLANIRASPENALPWPIYGEEVYYGQGSLPEEVEHDWLMLGTHVFLDEEMFAPGEGDGIYVCLLIVAGQSLHSRTVRGLILEPTSDDNPTGEYKRLGMFMTAHGDSMKVLAATHYSESHIPCLDYDAETHRHTIRIV